MNMSTEKTNHLLSEGQLEQVALRFRLLGEPMRLRILQAVCRKPRTVNEIVEAVAATQANVSKHLALLAARVSWLAKRMASVLFTA